MKQVKLAWISGLALLAASCGSGGISFDSYDNIRDAIDNPNGTVTTGADAQGVAESFALASTGSFGTGLRAGAGQFSIDCPSGGSYSYDFDTSNSSSGEATYIVDNCCWDDECCQDGGGSWYYDDGGLEFCGAWDMTLDCYGTSGSYEWAFCFLGGEYWYAVEYNGEYYAVSGFYVTDGLTGTWTVRDSQTTWTCAVSDGMGSCTSSDGETVSW